MALVASSLGLAADRRRIDNIGYGTLGVLAYLGVSGWQAWSGLAHVPWLYVWGLICYTGVTAWVLWHGLLSCGQGAFAPPRWWGGWLTLLSVVIVFQIGSWPVLFPHHTAQGGWAALVLPLAFAWYPMAALPCLWLVSTSGSSVVVLATVLGCLAGRSWRLWVATLVAALGWCLLIERGTFSAMVLMRVDTYRAVLGAILAHPWGIGWDFNAYQQAVLLQTTVPVLPHPASDVLWVILRGGWWTLLPLGAVVRLWWRLPLTPLGRSLRTAGWLAWCQTSLTIPHVGLLAWLLLCAHLIERRSHEEHEES